MASRTSLSDKQISENKTNSIMNTIAKRASYYRANVNRFVEDYLQIHYLKLFQKYCYTQCLPIIFFCLLRVEDWVKHT